MTGSSSSAVGVRADADTDGSPRRAGRVVAVLRVLLGAVALGVVLASYAGQRAERGVALVDFLGYFTNLTSLLAGAVLVAVGAAGMARRVAPVWLAPLRGVLTACLLVVAVVYYGISPGDGGATPGVSLVLHLVVPGAAALDWLLVGDRPPLPWGRLWWVLPYPLLWLAVTLVRGRTDGWVPYGFLLPERGGASLALHVAGLVVLLLAAGALVWGASRRGGAGTVAR